MESLLDFQTLWSFAADLFAQGQSSDPTAAVAALLSACTGATSVYH